MTDEPETYILNTAKDYRCRCGRAFGTVKGLNLHIAQTDARHYPYEGAIAPRAPEPEPVYWEDIVPTTDIFDRPIKDRFFYAYTRHHEDRKVIMTPRTFYEIGLGRLSVHNQLYERQHNGRWLLYRRRPKPDEQ